MSTFKKAKAVMLPTNQKANGMICKDITGQDKIIAIKTKYLMEHEDYVGHHLYIISDDEIKEGDWCINTGGNIKDSFPFRATKEVMNNKFIKKIIATTDTSLNIHQKETFYLPERVFYLPYPSQEFIEKYIEEYNKGREIKEVLVEYEDIIYNPEKDREYQSNDRINIEDCDKQTRLKINPKDNTITIKIVKDCYTREEVDRLLDEQASKTTAEMLEKFKGYKSKDEIIDLIVRAVSESHD